MIDYKSKRIGISAFGGLNHTDVVRPGEWYRMCNLSDRYAPLLAPRRSRERFATIAGQAEEVVLKNGIWYYTVPGEGIYCYAPEGDNPFSEVPTTEPVCIYESEKSYRILEMGNRLLCLPEDGSGGAVSIKSGAVKVLGAAGKHTYRSRFPHPAQAGELCETNSYLLTSRGAIYSYFDKATDTVKSVQTAVEQGTGNLYRDAAAANLLNITFTYAFERDDGSWYWLHAREPKYNPSAVNFNASRYFLGTDNLFYHFDYDSKAVTQITAPQIAVLLHLGCGVEAAAFPDIGEGSYINLSVGPTLNRNHALKVNDVPILPKQLLRVARVYSGVADNSTWGPEGWTHCILLDYDAALVKLLQEKDLIFHSRAYTLWVEDNAPQLMNVSKENQQIYPEYIEIESAFPALTNCLEHNNRIWGTNNDNNDSKASAQGNFETWDDYRGLVSDSYAVSVGSNDRFTASCVIGDYLFFFKEHSYTMLYGTRPANFCTETRGDFIGPDAAGACSLQVIGTSAYFMGTDGRFYRFQSQGTTDISAALGEQRYMPLSAAHSRSKYYCLATTDSGEKQLLVYNALSGTWWVEDAAFIRKIGNIRGRACALCDATDGADTAADILLLEKWNIPQSEQNTVEWFCESGLLGLESDDYQSVSNLKITFESEVGATVEVLAKYDNDTAYTPLARFVSKTKGTRTEKIAVRRCAFMRLKLVGTGFSKIYRISYLIQQGSEK